MSKYELGELPYDYSALEPYISGKIVEIHHDKHHLTYVKGANLAIEQLEEASDTQELSKVNQIEKNLAFNLGGHVNHTVYWQNMSPEKNQSPEGELLVAIQEQFGSVEKFKGYFSAVAVGVQGSGWAILAWDQVAQQLVVLQQYDHQGNLSVGLQPILLLDLWEHAYYLDYLNVRPDYIKAWWSIVNWQDAGKRFDDACRKSS